ncbi:hypothetical protein LV779_08715 [Streptomyces thinghirensis]|nr:hypothetical protein [Streptomyces thinghirensis]
MDLPRGRRLVLGGLAGDGDAHDLGLRPLRPRRGAAARSLCTTQQRLLRHPGRAARVRRGRRALPGHLRGWRCHNRLTSSVAGTRGRGT